MAKIKTEIGKCGCEIPSAKTHENKTKFRCSKCNEFSCGKHVYFYVDGNNISITKNARGICIKCIQ